MEQQLRVAHEHAASLARFPEENPDPVLRLSAELLLLYANASAHQRLGELELELGQRVAAPFEEPARQAIANGGRIRRDITSGDRTFSFTFTAVGGDVNIYGQDITERKRAEESLRLSEEKYRALFNSMTEGFTLSRAIFDDDGKFNDLLVLDANRSAERANGLRREEFVGKTWRELWPGAEDYWWETCEKVLRQGGDVRYENHAVVHDRWYEVHYFAIANDLLGSTFTDVSERKNAELERERLIAALREADRRKDEFLGVLSHELRNPLAPICNSLAVLDRAAPGSAQAARAHAVIRRQVDHMSRLVDDLLDVTRISRGKLQLRHELLDLCDVLRRAVEDQAWLFSKNGVSLEADVPSEKLWVHGDATRIAQVVGNLLQNAAKFTARGGHARLSAERIADGPVRQGGGPAAPAVVVRVRDSGAGIAGEMLPHVFEPFAQADRTLDRSSGGLGLGLALVKGIVELHGGAVRARSEGPGHGAEFAVELPLSEPAARWPAECAHAPTVSCKRILIIEDNIDSARSLADLLECRGHVVTLAHDGLEGLALAGRFGPDVVLCDIGLPGMDGYDVAAAIRADPRLGATFLVALSGYARQEDIARARQAGFDSHVAKPPDLGRLDTLLENAVPPRTEADNATKPGRTGGEG